MRGIAGELTKHDRKMTATHLRQRSQLVQREVFGKIGLQTLNCSSDPGGTAVFRCRFFIVPSTRKARARASGSK